MFSHVFINCCSYGKCHFHLIFNGRHRFLCMPPLCSVPFVKCHYNFQILCSNCSQCSFYLLANCAVRRASYSTNHINSIEMKIKQWINHLAMHYTFYIARRGTHFLCCHRNCWTLDFVVIVMRMWQIYMDSDMPATLCPISAHSILSIASAVSRPSLPAVPPLSPLFSLHAFFGNSPVVSIPTRAPFQFPIP